MLTLFLVRHAQYEGMGKVTAFRKPGFALSSLGKKQAVKLAAFLAKEKPDAIYTSPITRCLETAEAIAKVTRLAPRVDKRITEVDSPYAGWDKAKLDAIVGKKMSIYDLPRQKSEGETREEVISRMKDFFDHVVKKHQEKKIVVVSHGDPIMCLVTKLIGGEFSWAMENYIKCGEYFKIDYQNSKSIKSQKITT